jgi:hypothetical protein
MDWISKNTGAPNKFLLITEGEMWGMDAVLEWFPALADRESITTPQGHEWLLNDEFYLRVKLYNDLKRCYFEGIDCIEEVVDREKQEYSYVYIYKPEIDSLEDYGALVRYQLNNSANYDLVYEGTEALIFKRKI